MPHVVIPKERVINHPRRTAFRCEVTFYAARSVDRNLRNPVARTCFRCTFSADWVAVVAGDSKLPIRHCDKEHDNQIEQEESARARPMQRVVSKQGLRVFVRVLPAATANETAVCVHWEPHLHHRDNTVRPGDAL